MKVFISLSGVSEEKWHDMSQSEKNAYLKKHPHSKYAAAKRPKVAAVRKGPASKANPKLTSKQFAKIAAHPEMYDHIAMDIEDLSKGKKSESEAAKELIKLSGGGIDKKDARKLVKQAAKNYKAITVDADYDGWLHDSEDDPKAITELFTMDTKSFVKKHSEGVM